MVSILSFLTLSRSSGIPLVDVDYENPSGRPQINEWKPPNECQTGALTTSLQWPTDLAVNTIDEFLYFLDGEEILIYRHGIIYRQTSCYP